MVDLETLFTAGRALWHGLEAGSIQKKFVLALAVGVVCFLMVLAAETLCGSRSDNYRSRSFAHDVVYWFYYRLGINYLLVAPLFLTLDGHLAFLDQDLLVAWPTLARVAAYLLVAEFLFYWWHRALHRFRFLWAFHTTHHAPARLTFASSMRFHPIEVFLQYCWYYVLFRLIGVNPEAWMPLMILMEFSLNLQHTQVTWKLGPLFKVFVTPAFHSYHHSTDPIHHGKNFSGGLFSFWDYFFGTAVTDTRTAPARFGLDDVHTPTFLSSLTAPFVVLSGHAGVSRNGNQWHGKPSPTE